MSDTVPTDVGGQTLYMPRTTGGIPAPAWSNGFPLPFVGYGDCPAGCFQTFVWGFAGIDFIIWFVVGYLILGISRKIREPKQQKIIPGDSAGGL